MQTQCYAWMCPGTCLNAICNARQALWWTYAYTILPSGWVSTFRGAELSPGPFVLWATTLKLYLVPGMRFWMVTCISPGRLVLMVLSLHKIRETNMSCLLIPSFKATLVYLVVNKSYFRMLFEVLRTLFINRINWPLGQKNPIYLRKTNFTPKLKNKNPVKMN